MNFSFYTTRFNDLVSDAPMLGLNFAWDDHASISAHIWLRGSDKQWATAKAKLIAGLPDNLKVFAPVVTATMACWRQQIRLTDSEPF